MAEPYEFRVYANLKAALQQIGQRAGYYYDVDDAAVKLDAEHGVEELVGPEGPRPCIVIEPQPESWEYTASGEVIITMPVTVYWFQSPVPAADAHLGEPTALRDEDRALVYHRGVADIEKAVTADTSRGGLSVDTRITDRRWNPLQGRQDVCAEVDLELTVYRSYGVPA